MQLEHSVIPISGLSAPLRLFHITDMHLTEVSEEDSEYAKAHAIPVPVAFRWYKVWILVPSFKDFLKNLSI